MSQSQDALAGAVATVTELIPQLRNVMMRKEAEACTALLAALAEARKDSERLDWLDQQDGAIDDMGYGDYRHYFSYHPASFPTARAVIDRARTPQPETPE